MSNVRKIRQFRIIGDSLCLRFSGSSKTIMAKILETTTNTQGEVKTILIDRLVHRVFESEFLISEDGKQAFPIKASGCYVTEFQYH